MSVEREIIAGIVILGWVVVFAFWILITKRIRSKEKTLQKLRVALVNDMHRGVHLRDGLAIKGFIRECSARALFRAHRRGI